MAENQGVMPPQYDTPVGQVRLLTNDKSPTPYSVNGTPVAGQGIYWWYSDAEIQALLDMFGGNPKYVAYRILMTVATSQTLLMRAFTSADLATRGDAIGAELRLQARQLRDDLNAENEQLGLDFARVVPTGGPALALPPWVEPESQIGYVVL